MTSEQSRFLGVAEVMYFVPDRRAATEWYAQLMNLQITRLKDPEHYFLRVGEHGVWFHLADERSPVSTGGSIAYWLVDDLDDTIARAERLGAVLHRGPLDREDGFWMCQLRDPFGNVLGLVGPRSGAGS